MNKDGWAWEIITRRLEGRRSRLIACAKAEKLIETAEKREQREKEIKGENHSDGA